MYGLECSAFWQPSVVNIRPNSRSIPLWKSLGFVLKSQVLPMFCNKTALEEVLKKEAITLFSLTTPGLVVFASMASVQVLFLPTRIACSLMGLLRLLCLGEFGSFPLFGTKVLLVNSLCVVASLAEEQLLLSGSEWNGTSHSYEAC